jgi:uncharacterized protein YjbJ (UPF0337 family)
VTTIFAAGSISIKKLDGRVKERIDKVIDSGFDVVVGDADGADSAIQSHLFKAGAKNTTVFCTGEKPRNNIGDWPTCAVTSHHASGTRAFFTAKDLRMAECADFGLMIWDAKSTGTLSNVVELLMRNKKSVVYVNKDKVFRNVGTVQELETLVSCMSVHAKRRADEKMRLSERIVSLKHLQTQMFA